MLTNKDVGYNIVVLREKQNISQKELAKCLGVKKPFLASLEEGRRQISLVYLGRISDILDCSVADLVSEYGDRDEEITTNSLLRDIEGEYELTSAELEVIMQAKLILKRKAREIPKR